MRSSYIADENIAKIRELFPACISEVKDEEGLIRYAVDFDRLRRELGDHAVGQYPERYHLDWPGKREALRAAVTPTTKLLRPAREDSVDFDTTKNLFIEGDNLDALKLLREHYLGKVRVIYIDPPYNTGSDLLYEDDFSVNAAEFLRRTNQKAAPVKQAISDVETNGRYHADWLSMMHPRLRLARDLLTQDGVIFISIANNEFANLKKVCDEVFGEGNFVECITWNKRIPKNDKGVGNIHEFVLLYVKDSSVRHAFFMRKDGLAYIDDLVDGLRRKNIPLRAAEDEIKKLYKRQGYDRGVTLYNALDESYRLWGKINMSWPNASTFGPRYEVLHPKTKKAVKMPDRGWRWKEETFNAAALRANGSYEKVEQLHDGSFRCGKIWFAADENQQPSSITYLDEVGDFLLRSILSFKSDGGKEVEKLFDGQSVFSYPKPTSLLRALLSAQKARNGDIYLDFFAGSCSTAHAIMQMNAEDGIQRRFIMVQAPEVVASTSEAAKVGYSNIAEIGKARIKRAAAAVRAEYPGAATYDFGFRSLKVDAPDQQKPNDAENPPRLAGQPHSECANDLL